MEAAISHSMTSDAGKTSVNALFAIISQACSGKTILVGMGNSMRGDDGLGPYLIHSINGKLIVDCIDAGSVPENYLETMVFLCPETIFFIDAADFNGLPGEIRLFHPEDVRSGIGLTHTGSVELIMLYLRQRIPGVSIRLIGVQSRSTAFNAPMSDEALQAVDTLTTLFSRVFPHA